MFHVKHHLDYDDSDPEKPKISGYRTSLPMMNKKKCKATKNRGCRYLQKELGIERIKMGKTFIFFSSHNGFIS